MVNQQLLDYIKQQLQQGKNQEEIKNILLANNWQAQDIEQAFRTVLNPEVQTQFSSVHSLPGVGFLLRSAFSIYKKRFFTFLGITIIPALITSLSVFILISVGILSFSFFATKFSLLGIVSSIFLIFLILLIVFIIQIWSQAALLYAIKNNQENIGIIESYRLGWYKIFSIWWLYLITIFIILGGYLFFIVPGIIFVVWFSLGQFILIAEDLKGINAILKSKEYVKNKWGGVFWRISFLFFLFFIFSLVLGFLSIFIPFGKFINYIIIWFLTPLVIIYLFLLYNNLKLIKGEFVFTAERRHKIFFSLAGFFGLLMILIVPFLIIFLNQARQKANVSKKESLLRNIKFELNKQELQNFPINGNISPSIQPILTQSPKPTVSPLMSNQQITAFLEGYVFIDKNKNKIFDSGDISFNEGYVILGMRLFSGEGKGTGIKVKPDNKGYFKIDISNFSGTYYASFISQSGSKMTITPAGSNKGDFLINGKETIKNYNFVVNLE